MENIPHGLCQCGCGNVTTVYRGKPRQYISKHQNRNVPKERRQKMSQAKLAYYARLPKQDVPVAYCGCGCGLITKVYRGMRRECIAGHKSIRVRQILRELNLGKKMSPEAVRKMTIANRQKRWTEERKAYMSNLFKGENGPNWQGGIWDENKQIRRSYEQRLWRKSVLEKDNHTCQLCGESGGNLEADHIKSFAEYPELRFDVNNGRALCRPCHLKTDNYGRKGKGKGVYNGIYN